MNLVVPPQTADDRHFGHTWHGCELIRRCQSRCFARSVKLCLWL